MRVSTCADEEGKVKKPEFSRSVYEHMLGERRGRSIQEYILDSSSNSNNDAFALYKIVKVLRWIYNRRVSNSPS